MAGSWTRFRARLGSAGRGLAGQGTWLSSVVPKSEAAGVNRGDRIRPSWEGIDRRKTPEEEAEILLSRIRPNPEADRYLAEETIDGLLAQGFGLRVVVDEVEIVEIVSTTRDREAIVAGLRTAKRDIIFAYREGNSIASSMTLIHYNKDGTPAVQTHALPLRHPTTSELWLWKIETLSHRTIAEQWLRTINEVIAKADPNEPWLQDVIEGRDQVAALLKPHRSA